MLGQVTMLQRTIINAWHHLCFQTDYELKRRISQIPYYQQQKKKIVDLGF